MNTYVAVNLEALRHNTRAALSMLAPQSRLLAVIKANAYGHGLLLAAEAFLEAGATWLGVSQVSEGVTLREAGIQAPVLVFLPPCGVDELEATVKYRLTATLVATSQLHDLAEACRSQETPADCQIYVDGGLSRLGGNDSLPDILDALTAFPMLQVTGVYTHFGPPGSGELLPELEALRPGGAIKGFAGLAREAATNYTRRHVVIHAAASRLFLQGSNTHLDLVRLGTLLYGQYPDGCRVHPLTLREDTMALRSRIIAVQTVPAGAKVGYGGEYVCRRETRLATVPVGTAQGLEMLPYSVAARPVTAIKAMLRRREGRRGRTRHAPQANCSQVHVPLVGRVSMDQCCLDITDAPEANIGTEVSLPARRLAVSSSIPRVPVADIPPT